MWVRGREPLGQSMKREKGLQIRKRMNFRKKLKKLSVGKVSNPGRGGSPSGKVSPSGKRKKKASSDRGGVQQETIYKTERKGHIESKGEKKAPRRSRQLRLRGNGKRASKKKRGERGPLTRT